MNQPTYRIAQALHARRAAVGLPKYGQHLTAASPGCMIVHAIEEAADLTEYLLAEAQRRKIVMETLNELSKEMHAELAIGWAYKIEKLYDLLGGKSAIEQYDKILGGGTVANDATFAPDPRDEALRRHEAIRTLCDLRTIHGGMVPDNDTVATIQEVIDLLGGEAALAKYDEILGTVANDATVAPEPTDNALPALLDELEAARLEMRRQGSVIAELREEVRRLTQANGDIRKERDRAVKEAQRQDGVAKGLRQERTALAAHVERLEKALEASHSRFASLCSGLGPDVYSLYAKDTELVRSTLAATPAQSIAAHDAAVKVAVLREVAEKWEKRGDDCLKRASVNLRATADRIEKEAANG